MPSLAPAPESRRHSCSNDRLHMSQEHLKPLIGPPTLSVPQASLQSSYMYAFLEGFGAMGEQPGTQREIKNSILPAFLQGFCILGERVKG